MIEASEPKKEDEKATEKANTDEPRKSRCLVKSRFDRKLSGNWRTSESSDELCRENNTSRRRRKCARIDKAEVAVTCAVESDAVPNWRRDVDRCVGGYWAANDAAELRAVHETKGGCSVERERERERMR
jgi:hypothetical protein